MVKPGRNMIYFNKYAQTYISTSFRNICWAHCYICHSLFELQLQSTLPIPLLLKLLYELMAHNFLIKFMGSTLVNNKFQVYSCIIQYLCIPSCAQHSKSSLLSPPYIWPLLKYSLCPQILTQVREYLWCHSDDHNYVDRYILALTGWNNLYKLLNLFWPMFSCL